MDKKPVIVLCLSQRDHEPILVELLSPRFTLKHCHKGSELPKLDAGIILVDGGMLIKHGGLLEATKKNLDPVLLPVLLLATPDDSELATASLGKSIDEMISFPVQQVELLARINLLLRLRNQSLEASILTTELRQSQASYRLITDNSSEWIYLTDLQGFFTYVNPSCERITGYSPDEFLTDHGLLERIIHPLDKTLFKRHQKEIKAGGEEDEFDFRIISRKKEVRWISHSCTPVFGKKGKYMGRRGSNRDITERMRTRELLLENQEYNRKLFDQSPVGLALTTWDGTLVDINPAFASIIGYGIEETKQLSYWDITPEKYAAQEQEQLRSLKKTGRYGPYEKEYKHKSGHLVPVRQHSLIIEKEGEQYIWSGVEDISEQKRTEEELRQSEERFKALHNASFGGIAIHQEGLLLDANQGLCEMTGYTPNELTGMNVLHLISEKTRDFVEEKMRIGFERPYEATCLHKSGKEFPVRIEARNVPYKGSFARVAEFRDISGQKQKEEELRQSEERFREFFEAANVGKSITLPTGEISVNAAFCKMLGYSKTKLEQKKWQELTPEEEIEPINKLLLPLLEGETESARFEKRYIHKNGSCVWADVSVRIMRDAENKPLHFITTVIDISDRKKAVEEQVRSLNLLNNLAAQVPGVVYQYRLYPDGTSAFPYSSPGIWGIYEVTPEQVREDASPVFTRIHPDDYDDILKTITESANKQSLYESEFRVILPEKGLRWRYCNAKPERLDDGSTLWHGIITDITGRKQNDELLSRERQRLASTIDGTRAGTWEWNIETGKTVFNEQWANMLGYTLEKLSPVSLETWHSLTHPDDLKTSGILLDKHFRGELDFYECELRMKHKDGHWVWFLDRGRVTMREKSGKPQIMHGTHQDITEKKNFEIELRESEKRFRAIVEGAPDPIFIQIDNCFAYLNQPARRLFGAKSEDELIGKPVLERIHPGFHKIAKERIHALNEKRSSVLTIQEQKFIRLNGEEVWVETTGEPILYKGNHGGLVFVRDITERKRNEEALSHSHHLMKYIIEHNQSAIAVHDKELRYIYVSQQYLDTFRVKEKDVIGKHHYEVFPDIPEKWRIVHQKALKGEVSREEEDIFYREDGSIDWTRWECRPWYEADGSIGGFVIYTEVINERKQKELEITSLNERLQILIESVQKLASAPSIDEVQKIVVKSARRIIGADGASLVFRENDQCYYVNEDALGPLWKGKRFPMDSCISGWVMQHKEAVIIEDIFSDKRIPHDAYSPTFVKSMAMVPISINEPIGAIGNYWKEPYTPTETELQLLQTLADATARAIENIQLYTELEDRVKLRTAQLEAANTELETFTYTVSHDLKAPLRGIDGYSKLLLDGFEESLGEEAAHFIRNIRSSTLQMNRLIDDLLRYSRLERSQFKREKLALKSLIESLLTTYHEELKTNHFTVKLLVPEVEILADSTGLSIALRNLIENSIKFTGGTPDPVIEIGFEEQADSWIIHVKDNGVGFDKKYHDRIFEIFQRLHRAEDYPGTGIGLALVAKAVHRMDGRTWAESAAGEGSVFFIQIPKHYSI